MPSIQYPFIDIAIHPMVRDRFARGDAMVLFAPDMDRVLWANGAGAKLFGNGSIYDFLDHGANASDITFRQLKATALQLQAAGDSRNFMMRIASGFQRIPVTSTVDRIKGRADEDVILFSVPAMDLKRSLKQRAQAMLEGFDDPDTHMAVLGEGGEIIASSADFSTLGLTAETAKALVAAVSRSGLNILKRPVPTGRGHLPSAIGKVSDDPAMHLLFCVETIIGHMDPGPDFVVAEPVAASAAPVVEAPVADVAVAAEVPVADAGGLDEALDALTAIEDPGEETLEALPLVEDETAEAEAAEEDVAPALADVGEQLISETVAAADETVDEVPVVVGDEQVVTPVAEAVAEVETVAALDAIEADDSLDAAREETVTEAELADNETAMADAVETVEEAESDSVTADAETDSVDAAAEAEALPVEPNAEVDVAAEAAVAEAESASADPEPVAVAAATPAFMFQNSGRPVRFVWKIDAAGTFREVSNEFAQAVGPQAADITNQSFAEVAARLMLDPDGKIGELLSRRDTWSGKTVLWPIEGTSLRVPVDLAALPTYSRDRAFDGFRGFGIVRLADVSEDESATGLTIGQPVLDSAVSEIEEAAADDAGSETGSEELAAENAVVPPVEATETETAELDQTETTEDTAAEAAVTEAEQEAVVEDETSEITGNADAVDIETADEAPEASADDAEPATDPIDVPVRAEPPALRIVENPARRHSDKVIQLEARRNLFRDGLSPVEQAAFREIARQLEPFGKRPNEELLKETAADKGEEYSDAALPTDEPAVETGIEASSDAAEAVADVAASHDEALVEAVALEPAETETAEIAETDIELEPVPLTYDENPPLAWLDDEDGTEADETVDETDLDDGEPLITDDEDDIADAADVSPATLAGDVLQGLIPPRTSLQAGLNSSFVDQMPVAMLVHSGDTLIHANPEFFRLTGYQSLQDLQDLGGFDGLLEPDTESSAEDRAGTMLLRTEGNHYQSVVARLQSVRWEDTTALLLAVSPVTAAKVATPVASEPVADVSPALLEAEEEAARLQVEVDELRSILETATDGVVIVGQDGEIRSMNRSASALFNYDAEETAGKSFAMLFAHESQKAVMDYLSGLSGHGVASVLNDGREVIGREASGGFLPLFMTMGRLSSSNGYCAVIRDITQWKRTEEELRNAKRAAETASAHKSDFLARVSHEIRTPLNAIIGFSDMMASERFGSIGHPRYVEYANDIVRSGRHVLDIVNDLLDISKIEAGEMDLDFASVGLNEAISEAVSLVQPQANGQRVIIRTSLSQSVPNVVADARSIKQIALNILANAIRYTPSGGQIVVSTAYEANGSVVMRIRDTGVGMTRAELEQAMKPFRQVATGSRKRGDGTGLGLPLTKAMVDANRASFAISSSPNEGTLVEITFPSPRVLAD